MCAEIYGILTAVYAILELFCVMMQKKHIETDFESALGGKYTYGHFIFLLL